jgi:hypothetical protein
VAKIGELQPIPHELDAFNLMVTEFQTTFSSFLKKMWCKEKSLLDLFLSVEN